MFGQRQRHAFQRALLNQTFDPCHRRQMRQEPNRSAPSAQSPSGARDIRT
jgi:hypothetical protein